MFMHVTYVSFRTLFKSASISESFDLNCILQKRGSFVYTWKYNNTRNTISFSVSKIFFTFLMTPLILLMMKIYA